MAGIGVGLIGTGFMGKCHALAYAAVNDLKVIEAAALLRAIAEGERPYPDFGHALAFERVIHVIARSARGEGGAGGARGGGCGQGAVSTREITIKPLKTLDIAFQS